jgi:Ca2+/Na+ antiporter
MITFILSVLFIIAFIAICLSLQIFYGDTKKKAKKLSDEEVKIDKKSLWRSFFLYLILGILLVIAHVFF